MFRQRFLKYVFVVLALALWAGTANAGITLTAGGGSAVTVPVTHVLGGGVGQVAAADATTVGVTSDVAIVGEAVTPTTTAGACTNQLTLGAAFNPTTGSPTYTVQINEAATFPGVESPLSCVVTLTGASGTGVPILVTVHIFVLTQPLSTALATPLYFSYQVAAVSLPATQTATINLPLNAAASTMTVDPASVPPWLSVTPAGGATPLNNTMNQYPITNAGNIVTFGMTTTDALAALTPGTVTANVRFNANDYNGANFPAVAQALTIQVVLNIVNGAPVLSLLEGPSATVKSLTWTKSTTVYPTPTVTPISSNETIPFSATCAVSSLPVNAAFHACSLTLGKVNGTPINGVAYGWGTPLSVILPHGLFDNQLYGTVVTAVIVVTPQGGAPLTYSYAYTIQPTDPTLVGLSPTAVAPITAGTLLLTLKGTNFVTPSQIYSGATGMEPTQVYFGSNNDNLNTLAGATVVVIDAFTITVSVPFGEIPPLNAGKAVTAAVGVANQTGIVAPTGPAPNNATVNLTVTGAPVVYGITSTASYMQPSQVVASPTSSLVLPNLAPYELVSIFGANFGVTGNVGGTLDPTYLKYAASVSSDPAVPASPLVSVTFKSTATGATAIAAPILFANSTQINVIVPSGLAVGNAANVTVLDGTATSDGLFQIKIVANDPGIFTINSDGQGQGAIIYSPNWVVNGASNTIPPSTVVPIAIYMTGLGLPDSTGDDATSNKASSGTFAACVQASKTTTGHPGYLEVVNKSNTATGYVAPTPVWKNLDGAVFQESLMAGYTLVGTTVTLSNLSAPCFNPAAGGDNVTVDFVATGAGHTVLGVQAGYAGFAIGSVAGLYQVNVSTPNNLTADTYNVVFHFSSTSQSQSSVTMLVQ